MRPDDYRKVKYNRSVDQNNFYSGTLPLSFMNNLHPPDETDIWQQQKSAIMTYSLSMRYNKQIRGLNLNIFQGAAQGFDPEVDAAITNQLMQEVQNLREQYYPTVKQLRNKNINQNSMLSVVQGCQQLFLDYTRIINMLNSSSFIPGNELIKRLTTLQSKIKNFKVAIAQYYAGDILAGESAADYFYQINTLLSMAGGIVLENEVLDSVSGWLPTNMEIKNIGTLFIGQDSKMAGVDNIVFDTDILNSIQISWEQSQTGANKKQKHTGTLFDFFSQMDQAKQESFFMSESEYEKMCQHAIATLQAKTMGVAAKTIIMKRDVRLFDSTTYTTRTGYTVSSVGLNTKFKQYSTSYFNALIWMKRLYELSVLEDPDGRGNYLERHRHYQAFINYSLSKMIPYILENNEYLLSNRYGVISFYDFFERSHKNYFTWGENKTAMLKGNALANAHYHILLRA